MNQEKMSRKFWNEFVSRYWEKEAVLLTGNKTAAFPKVETDELFHAVVACTQDFLKHGRQKVRLFIDDSQIDLMRGGHRNLLPALQDISFENYNARLVKQGIENYGLVIADWHQFDRSIWERIVTSLKELTDRVGVSASRVDTQIFLGNYRRTPFGVHVDAASAFHFPVIGKKVMRFWPHDFAVDNPALHHARKYDEFLPNSTVLSAGSGDTIYWPSHYWHVGEASGQFSVTWRFAYWIADGMRQSAVTALSRVFNATGPEPVLSLPGPSNSGMTNGFIDELTRDVGRAVSSIAYRELLTRIWLEKLSAYGFLKVPENVEFTPFDENSVIRLKPPFQILLSEAMADSICVAAGGRSLLFPSQPEMASLVKRLNKGDSISVGDLAEQYEDHEILSELIAFCGQSGALTIA